MSVIYKHGVCLWNIHSRFYYRSTNEHVDFVIKKRSIVFQDRLLASDHERLPCEHLGEMIVTHLEERRCCERGYEERKFVLPFLIRCEWPCELFLDQIYK